MSSLLRSAPKKKPLSVRASDAFPDTNGLAWKSLEIFQYSHDDALDITFHRSLRVPPGAKARTLPPGLGHFPVYNTDQFCEEFPHAISKEGGAFIPMYKREAVFISFNTTRPFAIKIFYNNVNVITGRPKQVTNGIENHPKGHWLPPRKWIGGFQDYVVPPRQLWVDGVATWNGVRQFVCDPDSAVLMSTPKSNRSSSAPVFASSTPITGKFGLADLNDKGKDKEEETEVQKIQFEIVPLKKKDLWIYLAIIPDRLVSKMRIEVWWKDCVVQVVREIVQAWGDEEHSKVLMVSCYGKQVGSFDCFADLCLEDGDTLYVYIDQLFSPKVPGTANCYSGGLTRQNIPKDLFRPEDWDTENRLQFTIQLLPVSLFCSSLDLPPPLTPVSKSAYQKYGLEFLEAYREEDGSTGDEGLVIVTKPREDTDDSEDSGHDNSPKASFHKSRSVNDFLKEMLREEKLKKTIQKERPGLIIDDGTSTVMDGDIGV